MVPPAPSSSTMPAAVSASRMRSDSAKSFALRAACRAAISASIAASISICLASISASLRKPPEAPEAPEAPAAPKEREKRIVIRDLEDLEDLDEAPGLGFMGDGPGVLRLAGRGRLGARVESLSPALGEYFGLKDGKGALVLEVLEGRSAAKAGLLAGDVITRVGDKPVADSRDLVGALRGKEGKVALRVVRHGSPRTIEAVLDEPGSAWTMSLGDRPGGSPGVRKQIVLRATDRDDLRHELDRLKRDLEKLRERLELELEEERGE